jgi:hypothetical protein
MRTIKPAKKKKAPVSFLNSPKTGKPSKSLNGRKKQPIKKREKYIFFSDISLIFYSLI